MLNKTYESLIKTLNTQQCQKAHWNQPLFAEITHGAGAYLWHSLAKNSQQTPLVTAYLTLIAEAINQHYCTQTLEVTVWQALISKKRSHKNLQHCFVQRIWNNCLELYFLLIIPYYLANVQNGLETLVKLWNLTETILSQPVLDNYLCAPHNLPHHVRNPIDYLNKILSSLLAKRTDVSWQSLQLTHLDCKQCHLGFLPGKIHAVENNVMCCHDRRYPQHYCYLYLTDTPFIVAHHTCNQTITENFQAPNIRIADEELKLNQQSFALPGMHHCHSYCISDQGKILISAIDSQRLWLVSC